MVRARPTLIGLLSLIAASGCALPYSSMMTISVPAADLRAQPHTAATGASHDPLQETQLLYGERVSVRRILDGWASVEALEQREFTHGRRWQGYPGWVHESALEPYDPAHEGNIVVTTKWATAWADPDGRDSSPWRFAMGTRLRGLYLGGRLWQVNLHNGETVWILYEDARFLSDLRRQSPESLRHTIIQQARQFLGDSYLWGGRTPHDPSSRARVTGVDCSGLINLSYRATGFDIPRDAHEQALEALPVPAPRPGDLVFLSKPGDPDRIAHVMLYEGDGWLIEGPGTGQTVRRIALAERLHTPLDELTSGTVIDGQTVSFGSFLP